MCLARSISGGLFILVRHSLDYLEDWLLIECLGIHQLPGPDPVVFSVVELGVPELSIGGQGPSEAWLVVGAHQEVKEHGVVVGLGGVEPGGLELDAVSLLVVGVEGGLIAVLPPAAVGVEGVVALDWPASSVDPEGDLPFMLGGQEDNTIAVAAAVPGVFPVGSMGNHVVCPDLSGPSLACPSHLLRDVELLSKVSAGAKFPGEGLHVVCQPEGGGKHEGRDLEFGLIVTKVGVGLQGLDGAGPDGPAIASCPPKGSSSDPQLATLQGDGLLLKLNRLGAIPGAERAGCPDETIPPLSGVQPVAIELIRQVPDKHPLLSSGWWGWLCKGSSGQNGKADECEALHVGAGLCDLGGNRPRLYTAFCLSK